MWDVGEGEESRLIPAGRMELPSAETGQPWVEQFGDTRSLRCPCGEVKYAVGYGSLDSGERSKMEKEASSSRWFL